jgi:hypothetical protein
MDRIVEFFCSPIGRWTQIGGGAMLVAMGVARGNRRWMAIGSLPLIAGLADLCLVAPFAGLPLRGRVVRRELGMLQDAPLVPPVLRAEQPMYASR